MEQYIVYNDNVFYLILLCSLLSLVLALVTFFLLLFILKKQQTMSLQLDQIKSALEKANTSLDNIAQDNTEQLTLIKELKKLLEEAQVPQEIIDLATQIEAKSQKIADEWPGEEPEPQG